MSRFERTALVTLVIVAIALWAAVGLRFRQMWQQPLGPGMALPTYTAAPQAQGSPRRTQCFNPRPAHVSGATLCGGDEGGGCAVSIRAPLT